MADVRVTCINKQSRQSSHQGITHLGSTNWKWTRQQVIDSIKGGSNIFYVSVNGKRSEVGVVTEANGNEYVRTHADGYYNDNLLALPECE